MGWNPPIYNWCNYLSILRLKLTHVNKKSPGGGGGGIILRSLFLNNGTLIFTKWSWSCTNFLYSPPWHACIKKIFGFPVKFEHPLPSNSANNFSKSTGSPSEPSTHPLLPWLNIAHTKTSASLWSSSDRSFFAAAIIACDENKQDDFMEWGASCITSPSMRGIHRPPVVSPHKGQMVRNCDVVFEVSPDILLKTYRAAAIWDANTHVTLL